MPMGIPVINALSERIIEKDLINSYFSDTISLFAFYKKIKNKSWRCEKLRFNGCFR